MSEVKLKPCPFCGGEALVTSASGAFGNWYLITCASCKNATHVHPTLGDAARAWNRRVYDERD
ncbi:MAG: Lar family restriction alleviation protein [Synergistaceae bacterium]|nr:Lar family restriction alleviation protein [Synergistaceae bacterium]MBR1602549.1 Lar family restriction alleviation protein [Synergistaceae bacterium]